NTLATLLALFLVSCAFTALRAERIFVLFDASCMDRIEYDQQRQDGRAGYYMYHVNLRPGEKLVLETGVESDIEQNYLPPNYLTCATGGFDAALGQRINANIDEVFLLRPEGRSYRVVPVISAAYSTQQGPFITYDSPKYRFRFDTENGVIGENLAYDNPGAKVYFEGREENGCTGNYLFRQIAPQSAYPIMEFKLAPELGIVEERNGSNNSATGTSLLTIRLVNGQPAAGWLRANCNPGATPYAATTTTVGGPVTYGNEGIAIGQPVYQQPSVTAQDMLLPPGAQMLGSGSPATAAPAPPAPAPAAASAGNSTGGAATPPEGVHEVAKGETLYGISRRYDITVDQLKEWNNMASTTLRVGQSLRVTPPQVGMASRGSTTASVPAGTPAATYPSAGVGNQGAAAAAPNPNEQMHIVTAGETVAGVALKYGYTEAKFREINQLGSREVIKVNQRLKTSDCNCPAQAAPAPYGTVGPQNYSTGYVQPQTYRQPAAPQSYPAQPQEYGNSYPAQPLQQQYNSYPAQPQEYGNGSYPAQPQQYNNNSYPAQPQQYGSYPTQPQEYGGSYTPPASGAPVNQSRGTTINNNTSFGSGAVVPEAYDYSPTPAPSTPPVMRPRGNGPADPSVQNYNPARNYQYNETYTPPGAYTGDVPITYGSGGSSLPAQNRRVHVVQEGESLYAISRRYNMNTDQLRALNRLTAGEVIIPFQRLYIE
ncbi:MAG: LysM peptidoglycan-binding domain-containing protein, partial [Saprospiraceae bacterium]